MNVLQPLDHLLLQLIRNLDGLFKILLRNTAGCIVARHIPLLREDEQLLNQFGIGFDREFQRFNDLLMMSYLHSGAIAARSQCSVGHRERGAEGCLKAKVVRDGVYVRVLKSTATMPNKSLISSGLEGSALSQPYSTQFSKVIFVSEEKHLFASHHRLQEMVSGFQFGLELFQREDGRIDRASEVALGGSQLRQ
jgi:hypothetical protein